MNSTLILSNPLSPRSPIQASAGTATFPSHARVSSSAPGSLYEVLKVRNNASQTEIKAAYRSLAKVYHPDVIKEMDGREFLEIQNAYSTLADPAARASYDLSLFLVGRQQQQTPRLNSNFVRRQQSGNSRAGYPTARRWETDQCW